MSTHRSTPRTFLIGHTILDHDALGQYLEYTDQSGFLDDVVEFNDTKHPAARAFGTHSMVTTISCFAKLCYRSLVPGKNSNIARTRSIESNFKSIVESGHGSVLEHVTFNFITTDCSRVFTHELVRHRVGTAFSQTSGRYVRLDDIKVVLPPELQPHEEIVNMFLSDLEQNVGDLEARVGLHGPDAAWHKHLISTGVLNVTPPPSPKFLESLGFVKSTEDEVSRGKERWTLPFDVKKRLTSAIRRIAPNGQTNEIAWSANLRSLRHMIELRTSRHAEWEIRHVFNEVAQIVEQRCPLMLYGGAKSGPDQYGLCEWTGLRV